MPTTQIGADIANTVRMLRTRHKGAVVIVEGGTDASVYGQALDSRECKLVPALNKSNVLEAMRILQAGGVGGCVAIVDLDFDRVTGKMPAGESIFSTDTHDLEGLLVSSPALEKVLAEYGSRRKLAGKNIRQVLLDGGQPLGYLRLISLQDGLDLRFEGLTFSDFVSRDNLSVDLNRMITAVKRKSGQHTLDGAALRAGITSLMNKHDPWDVCCGHDLIQLLSIGLRRYFGSCKAGEVLPRLIERSLRLAYERTHFAMTDLYAALRAWESANTPFTVLPKN